MLDIYKATLKKHYLVTELFNALMEPKGTIFQNFVNLFHAFLHLKEQTKHSITKIEKMPFDLMRIYCLKISLWLMNVCMKTE